MTSTTHAYFDLFTAIKGITSPEIAAPVAQSTAWKIDAMIVQAARQIYKGVKEHMLAAGIDSRAELTLALNEQANAEQNFLEVGSSMTGPIATIKELMYQREAWIALAEELTPLTTSYDGKPKTYVHKDLEDGIFEIGVMKVSSETKRRITSTAKRRAEAFGAPEDAARLAASKIARKEDKLGDMAENLRDQAQGVAYMLHAAQQYNLEDVELNTTAYFSSLTLPTQRALLENAMSAADRALDWAADNRSLTEADYDFADLSSAKFEREVKAVLKTARFTHAEAQNTAAAVNVG